VAHYKQPSRFNFVTLLMLAALGGAVYAASKFAPPFWRDRQVKAKLEEAGNRFWRDRGVPGIEATLREELTTQIRAMGVDDPGLIVTVERTPSTLRVAAAYTVIVSHPGRKITTLRFSPSFETDTKSPFD
jgi:hypothetical protein